MDCMCDNQDIHELKLEADISADPVWCDRCGCNLELEDMPISAELKKELLEWGISYGEWIDWDKDRFKDGGEQSENDHNAEGSRLLRKIQAELPANFTIAFSPSQMAEVYQK
ncbi:hypothetical protein [Bacillus sp. 1P06AnD]|uniref:hypothetical protein n=1 Tax=Bacillus sp. 1P06AnD TaxID=3132208 RepID=UPI0039A3F449